MIARSLLAALLLVLLAGCVRHPLPPRLAERRDVYTAAEARRLAEQDAALARFVGDLNGIHFAPGVTAADMGCTSGSGFRDATPQEAARSGLGFHTADLPAGAGLVRESAVACETAVVFLTRQYRGSDWQVTISRLAAKVATVSAPRERMGSLQVAAGLRLEELLRVAEGMQ